MIHHKSDDVKQAASVLTTTDMLLLSAAACVDGETAELKSRSGSVLSELSKKKTRQRLGKMIHRRTTRMKKAHVYTGALKLQPQQKPYRTNKQNVYRAYWPYGVILPDEWMDAVWKEKKKNSAKIGLFQTGYLDPEEFDINVLMYAMTNLKSTALHFKGFFGRTPRIDIITTTPSKLALAKLVKLPDSVHVWDVGTLSWTNYSNTNS